MNLIAENIGALIHFEIGRIPETVTAGAGNDNVEVNGPAIDLLALDGQGKRKFHSCKVGLLWEIVQAGATNFSVAMNIQTANVNTFNDGSQVDLAPAYALTIVKSGAGTFRGVVPLSVPLVGAKQYIRLQSTVDLSAGGVDTAKVAAWLTLGGVDVAPVA